MGHKTSKRRDAPVTAESVIDTAVRLIDEEGLEALTMRRLAKELGVEPVTVYRQLPNKEAILAGVAERLWAQGPRAKVALPADATPGDWRNEIRAMWLGLHALMQEHPNAIPILAKGSTYSGSAGAGTLTMARIFNEAGLSPDEAAELLHIIGACVVGFGFATLWTRQVTGGARPEAPAGEVTAPSPELAPYLARMADWDPRQLPRALDLILGAFDA